MRVKYKEQWFDNKNLAFWSETRDNNDNYYDDTTNIMVIVKVMVNVPGLTPNTQHLNTILIHQLSKNKLWITICFSKQSMNITNGAFKSY